jgi:Cd2+/Zn2+-exporting ATPase
VRWFVIDEPFSQTFYRAMAVLVAASPCALAISVPSAVLSGVARAARGGVLVKGGGPLENLGTLTSIAFDKTGTLTEGKPKLTEAVPRKACPRRTAGSGACGGRAQRPPARGRDRQRGEGALGDKAELLQASDVKSITGRGVQAQLGGETVHIGKPVLFTELPDSTCPRRRRGQQEAGGRRAHDDDRAQGRALPGRDRRHGHAAPRGRPR